MEQPFEKRIREMRADFDTLRPTEGHTARFANKLAALPQRKPRVMLLRTAAWISAAAVLVLCISTLILRSTSDKKEWEMAAEFQNATNYYAYQHMEKAELLQETLKRIPESDRERILSDLQPVLSSTALAVPEFQSLPTEKKLELSVSQYRREIDIMDYITDKLTTNRQ